MEAWAWLVAYVVGFALLQVALYRYLRDDGSGFDSPTPGGGEMVSASAGEETDAEEMAIRCQHCGAVNDNGATFRFCRECTQPIQ